MIVSVFEHFLILHIYIFALFSGVGGGGGGDEESLGGKIRV